MDDEYTGQLIKERYKLIDELAKGTFGTVYITRDLVTNYLYAIKVLHNRFMRNAEIVTRFQREAHLPLSIHNPHIVRVVDFGHDGRFYFIVMDYIDGHSLRQIMTEQGPLPPAVALNYTQQIVTGLDAAFKQGVVHRDLKPQNIIINNKSEAKITDFGLARSRETPTITDTEEFMGTAYYISPEQIERGHAADTRSDLYSVAAIFFEMLAGRPPYQGSGVMELIFKHKSDKIPSICQLRPELPPEMDAFFQKALAKQADQRYQTPQEFLAALKYLQSRLPLPQPPSGPIVQPVAAPNSGPLVPAPHTPPAIMPPGHTPPSQPLVARVSAQAPTVRPGPSSGPLPVPPPDPIPISISQIPTAVKPLLNEIIQKQARLVNIVSGETFPLLGEVMIIGRQDPTRNIYPDIILQDRLVGRKHARIRRRNGTFTIEDLHSRNKTRINGDFLPPDQERTLKKGDIVRIGNIELRFEQD